MVGKNRSLLHLQNISEVRLDKKNGKPLFWVPPESDSENIIRIYFLRMFTTVYTELTRLSRGWNHEELRKQIISIFGSGNAEVHKSENNAWTTLYLGKHHKDMKNVIVRLSPGYVCTTGEFPMWKHASLIPRKSVENFFHENENTKRFFAKDVWVGSL